MTEDQHYVLACVPPPGCGYEESFDETNPRGKCPHCRRPLTLFPATELTDADVQAIMELGQA